jgi:alpha-tubulin suppressor-like RCC1 family protein
MGRLLPITVVLLALAAGCSDSLVDHRAGDSVLRPACPAGQVRCGDRCVTEDPGHCGDTCTDCAAGPPLDPRASAICTEEHTCAVECAPGLLRNGGACELATAVSAGFAHACALTEGGRVKCWGANEHGQLGDGTTTDRSRPVDVVLPAPATAVGAGFFHTCAAAGGSVYCWGDNATGSLGDGTFTPSPTPVAVSGVTGVGQLAAGGGQTNTGQGVFDYGHSCARSGGELRCWGGNESGQLGNGTFEASPSPGAPVPLPGPATTLAVGDRHTCAIVGGELLCWGSNSFGQVGDGSGERQALPRQVIPTGVLAVATGAAHTCAVADGGAGAEVLCWGSNSEGQSDAGDNNGSFTTPHRVDLGAVPAPALASAGRAHSCVLAPGVTSGVTCFGANDASQLGGPATTRGVVRPPLPPATTIASGYNHSCVLLSSGGVSCWGANDDGQLGRGTSGGSSGAPALVSGR